ncbi:MAG: PAS domain-containing protein [Trueperaceae bacterium]
MNELEILRTQLHATEQRLQSLLRVNSSFAKAIRAEEVYDTVIGEGMTTLGARAGAVTLLDKDVLTIVASKGHDPGAIHQLKQQPLNAVYPVAEAVRLKEPLLFHDALQRLQRYPHLEILFHATTQASAYLPLLVQDQAIGALTLSFSAPQTFDSATRDFLDILTNTCAQTLNRALLFEKINRSETQFRTLAETLPGFVWMDSEGGVNLYMNHRWEDFTGQSVEAARVNGWHDMTHPEDIPKIAARWARSRPTGEPYEMEMRHRAKDGHYHWFLSKGLPIRDETGKITHWVGTSINIQDRKTDLEVLRLSEERYRTLFNSIDEGFCIIEVIFEGDHAVDYRFVEVNPMFELHTGLKNAVGKTARELVPGLESHWFELYGNVAKTGKSVRRIDESQAMDGRWFELYASRVGGDERRVAVIFNNVTERKRAELALRHSEARLALTVQAGNLGIWDSDLLKKHTYWSREQEKLFGLEAGQFEGGFSKYVHSEDRTRVLRKIATVKESGEDYQDEFRVVLPKGEVRWLAGRGRVLRDSTGKATRLIGVNLDITARKRRELNTKFLLELNSKVRSLRSAADIEKTVMAFLGNYLEVSSCNLSYVDKETDKLEVHHNHQRDSGPNLEGVYKLSQYVTPNFFELYKRGQTIMIPDVTKDNRLTECSSMIMIISLGLHALLIVPYLKEGRWVATLNISCNTPRVWREDERELAENVAAQFIPAIERARSEEAAAVLAERFKLTEISARSFLYEWDVSTGNVWRSQGFEAVTGFLPQHVPNTSDWWNSRIHPDEFVRTRDEIAGMFRKGGDYSVQYRVKHQEGYYIHLWDRGHITLDGDGNVIRLLGTSTDISAQKQLELELAETAARLDATIRFLPLGFCLLSSDYRYIRINQALADINGLSVEDHLGQKVSDILPFVWHMIEPILKRIETTLEPVLNLEVKHPTKNRTWLVSYYPVPNDEGGLLGFGSISLEITERQQTLTTLRETNVKLRDLTNRQQRFVADAAHELRAPLTSIRGNLELLTRYQAIPVLEQQEILHDVYEEAVRLSSLVEDLLELARSDSGLKMRLAPVHLATVLLDVWDKVQFMDTSHIFELHHLPHTVVVGDEERLKQLAFILLENATKYTPEGGTIRLGLNEVDTHVTFFVGDNGIGIAEEELPHVFERFYRADKARTRAKDPGGTGLGLSIAEWIVTGHKGKIWLESKLGQGTTIFVTLPLYIQPDQN